ncbi:hypothetical protein FRC10_006667 [Ceratobasidium sp. 414]|nr:hypothetical protein FRC10_006667 [Ceratobasidium sp. 414]
MPSQPVAPSIHADPAITSRLLPQGLPADILILILEILSRIRTEIYAPLICSHVCARWRSVIIENPSLWSYVDTSRGKGLTHLWLSRSKKAMLDVRLWENPMDCDLMQQTYQLAHPNCVSNADSMIEEVKGESYRWRSLDIAFCAMRRIGQTLEFLGETGGSTLHLESLTIGPMGSTTLVPNRPIDNHYARGEFPDIDVAQSYLRGLNVTCKALRIDTYPVCPSPIAFSPRLTSLEVFTGGFYTYTVDLGDWANIISQTPSLVHLRLVNFSNRHVSVNLERAPSHPEIQLLALEKLELSGRFVLLTSLFARSSLPKLEYLLLDSSIGSDTLASRLATIASVSPFIQQLRIHASVNEWGMAFQHLRRVREVTFFEMGWDFVLAALIALKEHPSLLRIRLERILDLATHELDRFKSFVRPELPPIELIDCWNPAPADPGSSDTQSDGSAGGSNYSSNSSFSFPHEDGYPSSEETDSDES